MIDGDSSEYNFISEEIEKLNLEDVVLTCEIGLRRGLGSKIIMDAVKKKQVPHYRHLAVDPYGNLEYKHYDNALPCKKDYTDNMKVETLCELVKYKEFSFFEFPDTYFFETMERCYPFYIDSKIALLGLYSVVHLDGPHTTEAVENEINFFMKRMADESIIIIDDYNEIKVKSIEWSLQKVGFQEIRKGSRKLIFKRSI